MVKATNISTLKSAKVSVERRKTSTSSFTTEDILHALNSQQIGNFRPLYNLSQLMLRDEYIHAFLEHRLLSTLENKLNVDVQSNQKFWEHFTNDILTKSFLKAMLKDYLLFGTALAFVEYEDDDGHLCPKFTHLSYEYLDYDQTSRKYRYQFETEFREIEPDSPHWLLITDWQPGTNSGLVPPMSQVWANKQLSISDWLLTNEKLANPISVITDSENRGGIENDRDDVASELQNNVRNRVLFLEAGQTFDVVQEFGTNLQYQTFTDFTSKAQTAFAMLILGGNLTSEVTGGSYAATEVHDDILKELINANLHNFATKLQKIFEIYYLTNGKSTVPNLIWQVDEQENMALVLDNILKFKQLTTRNIENIDEIASKLNLVLEPQPQAQEPEPQNIETDLTISNVAPENN